MVRGGKLRAILLAACLSALPPAAYALDDSAPFPLDFGLSTCQGSSVFNTSTIASTGTPSVRLHLQDAISGLRIGEGEHLGGNSEKGSTVLLLHFNNPPGVLIDSASVNNTITQSGTPPTSVAGQAGFGQALNWTGANQYVKIASSATLASVKTQLTIQAWINPTDTAARPIFEWNTGTSSGVYLWQGVGTAGSLYGDLMDATTADHVLASPAVVTANVWQLVTFTYDNSVARLYLNDVQAASASISLNGNNLLTTTDAYVGYRPSGGGTTFSGLIDEVRVLNRALSATDVASDYYSGLVQFSTSGVNGKFTNIYLGSQHYTPPSNSTGTTAISTITVNAIPLAQGANNYVNFFVQDQAGNTLFYQANVNVQTGPPKAPQGLQGVAQSTGSILWTWSAPDNICTPGSYSLYYSSSASPPLATGIPNVASPSYGEGGLAANTVYGRQVSGVSTAYGQGSLSAPTSAYTTATAPSNLASTFSLTTTGLGLSWNGNGNPGYTRWEVSISSDSNFVLGVSTPIPISSNYTSSSAVLSGLSPSTTYYVRVRAENGNGSDFAVPGSSLTGFAYGAFSTLPSSSTSLIATAAGVSSITWSWALDSTATGYALVTSTDGLLGAVGPQSSSITLTGLATNTQYSALLRIDNASGSGALSAAAAAFTLAKPPAPGSTAVTSVSTGSIAISWNPQDNPVYTVYQISVATNSVFNLMVTTNSTTSSTFTLTGLLPQTTYFLRVRALNGDSLPSAFDATVSTLTATSTPISSTSTPPSPYAPGAQAIGVWHYDEAGGTKAADASGFHNDGALTCFSVGCSTPTFTPSFSGMGTAVQFSGVQNTLCRVPDSASLEATGPTSVEAWVNPSLSIQVSGAGIVAKGGGGDANLYTLDIFGGKARFLINDSGSVQYAAVSTQSVNAGQWTHLAGVYDESGHSLSIYVNGTLSNSIALPATTRTSNAHEVSIGSRQSASGAYDLGFNGLIDEVHIFSRALSASDVATDYRSALPAQVTLPAPNQNVSIILSPNALGSAGTILVSSDPIHFPLLINASILSDGLNSPPTGFVLVPGSVVEVVINIGGAPFTGTLGSSATLILPYPDANNRGLIDGISPPTSVDKLAMFTFNPTVVRWDPLPTSVDTANKRVLGLTPHFSVFALFAPKGLKPDVSNVIVYPVPWKPESGGKFDSASLAGKKGLRFDNLPLSGFVRIFTLSAELVVKLPFGPTDVGTLIWDGKNGWGKDVASGVYFAYVKSSDGSSRVLKFAIER